MSKKLELAKVYTLAYINNGSFEWDEQDPHAFEFYDNEHSEIEDRYIRIGKCSKNKILTVVFCERSHGSIVRIISVRTATSVEVKKYEERI